MAPKKKILAVDVKLVGKTDAVVCDYFDLGLRDFIMTPEGIARSLSLEPVGFTNTIGDAIVDNYFPALDGMGSAIDRLEEKIFVEFRRQALAEVFALRKELLAVRKLVGPRFTIHFKL